MRRISFLFALIIVLGATTIAHGQDYDAPFGAFFTGDADVGLVAVMPTGETMGVLTESDRFEQIITIRGAVWFTSLGTVTVLLNPDGLPESMSLEGVTLLFDNYGERTVDIVLVPDAGEPLALVGQEVDAAALEILRGFASLKDVPFSAADNGIRAKRLDSTDIFLRSVAAVAHVGGAVISAGSCLGLGAAAVATLEIGVGTLLTGAAGLACLGAVNTVVTLPGTVTALWNAFEDPQANLVRLQETDSVYLSTSDSIIVDLSTMTEPASTAASIGATVISASATSWADGRQKAEAARLAREVISQQQGDNSDPSGGLFSEYNSPPPLFGSSADEFADDSPDGVYDTTYGAMTFGERRASYLSGSGGGRILYNLYGRSLVGHWIDDGSSSTECATMLDGSANWGSVLFTFSDDFSSFEGFWSFCNYRLVEVWNGSRHVE